MNMPIFLIIGTAKAATTSLHQYIKQHPEVYMSSVKETRFFDYEGVKPNMQGPARDINFTSITDLASYQKLFADVLQEKAVGEAYPIYLYSSKAPNRIKNYLPQAKLIAILRNPAERAYSSYIHMLREGHETLSFEEGLKAEPERIANNWSPMFHYLKRGFYSEQIQRYLNLFQPEQIKFLLYEDFRVAPEITLKEIFQFIEIDSEFKPDMSEVKNVGGMPKNKIWHQFLTKTLKYSFKRIVPRKLGRPLYRQLIDKNLAKKESMSPEIRQYLTQAYREDIIKLESLIDRDLSQWLG